MAKPFTYVRRSAQEMEKRASQQAGDFQGFIKDEYRTYTVRKGDNSIRILPPTWENPEHYALDVWTHYGVGPDRASVICLYKMGKGACPVCEARQRLEASNADEQEIQDLKPSKRAVVWIIDRKDEDQGPVLWPMPWTLDRDIAKVSKDRETGELYLIDHPDEGYDVYFEKVGEGIGTKYAAPQLARRPSSIDPSYLEYIVECPIPDTLRWRTYDEVKALFSGGGGGATTGRGDSPRGGADGRAETARDVERAEKGFSQNRDERRADPPPAETQSRRRPLNEPPREERRADPPPREERREEAPPAADGKSRAAQLRERWANRGNG